MTGGSPLRVLVLGAYGLIGANVARAVEGKTPPRTEADLVVEAERPLVDIISATRRWLGFPAFGAVMAILWIMLARPDLPTPFG